MMQPMYEDIRIAGVTFEPHPTNLKKIYDCYQNQEFLTIRLYRDYFDPNAIAVTCEVSNNFYQIGYIPKGWSQKLIRIGIENIRVFFNNFTFIPRFRSDGDQKRTDPVGAIIRVQYLVSWWERFETITFQPIAKIKSNEENSYLDKIIKSKRKIIL